MAANPRDILIRPIITEKTSQMMQENKYTFQVPLDANKVEIRQAVEAIFKVKVLNVLTDLELTLGSISNKTKKVYQFFITTPYFEYSDPSIGIHNIQVEHFTDIKEII